MLDEGPTRMNLSRPGGRGRPLEREGKNNPFVLSEALSVVPAKLVWRIRWGEFVDMAELLKDNMEVERRRAAQGGERSAHPGQERGPRPAKLVLLLQPVCGNRVRKSPSQSQRNVGIPGYHDCGGQALQWTGMAYL